VETERFDTFKGAEAELAKYAMVLKMWSVIILICVGVQGAVFMLISLLLLGPKTFWLLGKVQLHYILGLLGLEPTLSGKMVGAVVTAKMPLLVVALLLSCAAYVLAPYLYRRFTKRAHEMMNTRHMRGMQLIPHTDILESIKDETPGKLRFGPITLPVKFETRHAFIAGVTGAGKTVCINQTIANLRPDSKVIIYDFKGDYLAQWYDPERDIIINPLDSRTTGWSIFNEVKYKHDVISVAKSLFPLPPEGKDPFWANSAAAIFRGIFTALVEKGCQSNKDILALATSSGEDIRDACASTPDGAVGASHLENPEDKQARAILSNFVGNLGWLEFAVDGDFSIKDWIKRPGGGFIFLSGRPELEDTLRPMYGLFLDLFGKSLLSQPDDSERRIYFIMDELANIQKLPTLTRLLTAGRSKGAVVIIGVQDFAGVKSIYGPTETTTIYNCCGTTLALNLKDPDTISYMGNTFGKREVSKNKETHSMGVENGRDGISESRDDKLEDVVLGGEIGGLLTFEGYLKIPDHNPTQIKLEYEDVNRMPAIHEPFILRDGYTLSRKKTEICKSDSKGVVFDLDTTLTPADNSVGKFMEE
jgi:type IV secretory pathway TraG/TraD family ATPase VirD4